MFVLNSQVKVWEYVPSSALIKSQFDCDHPHFPKAWINWILLI